MRPSVCGPPDRAVGRRGRPIKGRTYNSCDPADALSAASNGTGQAVRPTGRTAGMPSDSSDGTDGSDGATSDPAVIMHPCRPRKNLTV